MAEANVGASQRSRGGVVGGVDDGKGGRRWRWACRVPAALSGTRRPRGGGDGDGDGDGDDEYDNDDDGDGDRGSRRDDNDDDGDGEEDEGDDNGPLATANDDGDGDWDGVDDDGFLQQSTVQNGVRSGAPAPAQN